MPNIRLMIYQLERLHVIWFIRIVYCRTRISPTDSKTILHVKIDIYCICAWCVNTQPCPVTGVDKAECHTQVARYRTLPSNLFRVRRWPVARENVIPYPTYPTGSLKGNPCHLTTIHSAEPTFRFIVKLGCKKCLPLDVKLKAKIFLNQLSNCILLELFVLLNQYTIWFKNIQFGLRMVW